MKRFAPFLCILLAAFLVAAPFWLPGLLRRTPEYETLTQPDRGPGVVLELWQVHGWEAGSSDRSLWLQRRGDEYHELTPGVFVRVVSMSVEMAREKMADPAAWAKCDLISFPSGLFDNPEQMLMPLAEPAGLREELVASARLGEGLYAYPYQMGASVMLYNSAKVTPPEDGEAAGYLAQGDVLCAQFAHQLRWGGLCPVDDPGSLPESSLSKWRALTNRLALTDFRAGNTPMMVGSVWEVQRMLNPPAKVVTNVQWDIAPLRREGQVFVDQVQYMGIRQGVTGEALTHAQAFVNSLIGEETQMRNAALSVLPARTGLTLYAGQEGMEAVEQAMAGALNVPNAYRWTQQRQDAAGRIAPLIDAASAAGEKDG
ncbi:MAG: hypothetical protein ACOYJA_05160 [Christensenellales bacterium]